MSDVDEVSAVFAKVAKNVAARYKDAEFDDIQQELWVWYLQTEVTPEQVLSPDWATARTLYTIAERYARKEKAAKQGPGDNYTEGEVYALVELLVNPETNDEYERLTGSMAEVMTAVSRLEDDLRAALCAKAAGVTYREIAESQNTSVATVHRRVQQALQSIVATLNGERPSAQ